MGRNLFEIGLFLNAIHREADGVFADCVHNLVSAAAAVASVVGWALAQEFFPSPTGIKELEKEYQLPLASDGSLIILLGMEACTGSVTGQVPEVFFDSP